MSYSYSTIVRLNGAIEGKPITAKEIKDSDGNITIEDSLKKGDTIYFEETGNIVEKTGNGLIVVNFEMDPEVVFKDGKFHNVLLFQPTISHNGAPALEPRPEYQKSWEVMSGSGKSAKRLYTDWPEYYVDYWIEQRRRCLEGYTVQGIYITGFHYWYLNFWKIKGKRLGSGYISPRFIDLDFDFFVSFYECLVDNENFMLLKRRQVGFSEKAASIAGYYKTFFTGCQVGIIAGEERYSKDTFSKMKNGLKKLSRFGGDGGDPFAARFIKDTELESKLGYSEEGVDKGKLSEGYCITTKVNLAAMAGKNFAFVDLEEYGMMTHSDIVLENLKPAMEEGGVMNEGKIILAGGTGGEMDKGAAFFQKQFYNPRGSGFKAFTDSEGRLTGKFYGAQWYYVTDTSGNSYHFESEFIVREIRKGIKSNAALLTYMTQMPLKPEEAFLSKNNTPFYTEALNAKINIMVSNSNEFPETNVRYDWILNKKGEKIGVRQTEGPATEKDLDGDLKFPFVMNERCRFKNGESDVVYLHETLFENKSIFDPNPNTVCVQHEKLYFAGTDSYDQSIALSTDSLGGFCIYKGYLSDKDTCHHFPIRLLWRPQDKNKFYDQTMMASIFWGAYNMIEHSKILIFNRYLYEGFSNVLADKPTILYQEKDSKTSNKKGVDASTKSEWETLFHGYVQSFGPNINDIMMAKKILTYETHKNSDLVIAAMLARLNYENVFMIKEKVTNLKDESFNGVLLGFAKVNGVMKSINYGR